MRVFVFVVACKAHATLHQPSVEDDIIAKSRQAAVDTEKMTWLAGMLQGIACNPTEVNELNNHLRGLALVKTNSILCYFICSYEEQIWQLRRWYKSGRLQIVLESIFTLLVGNNDRISIRQLTWNQDNYNESLLRLSQLKALGMCVADQFSLFCLS